jgi:hypothetical protein
MRSVKMRRTLMRARLGRAANKSPPDPCRVDDVVDGEGDGEEEEQGEEA